MKKTLAMLLAFVMLLSLCACGNDDTETSAPGSSSQSTTESTGNSTGNTDNTTDNTDDTTGDTDDTTGNTGDTTDDTDDTTVNTQCSHNWKDATCGAPKTCTKCGATEGSADGHSWKDATCNDPKTCTKCGATDGNATGHTWTEATCTAPKTCTKCNVIEGSAVGHSWKEATYTEPKTCTTCGATEGTTIPMPAWTFTDGGDHILATNDIQTVQIPIDTSHIPESYEDDRVIQTVVVHRRNFCFANGWIFYSEYYSKSIKSKVNNWVSSSVNEVGYSMIKMDGTGQSRVEDMDTVIGYADGYLYYVRLEGRKVCGEEEFQWLCKRAFTDEGNLGAENLVAELEGLMDNEGNRLEIWIDGDWIYYSCKDFDEDGERDSYKIKLDGTGNNKIS